MKILHICVGGPYTDGWNYQENMLTKFQAQAGHDVSLVVSQWAWGDKGEIEKIIDTDYVNDVGVKVYRLPIKGDRNVFYRYKRYKGFYDIIESVGPDVIFVHNLQFFDVDQIVKYAKNHSLIIYADNHADFTNSARSNTAKLFYKTVWRHYAQLIEPYTKKFYGVLPSRVDFMLDVYKLPREKCELLVMGGDDDLVEMAALPEVIDRIRKQHGIEKGDFLIMTGGKIDEYKTQTLLLMEAIQRIKDDNIKLVVFGSVDDNLKKKVDELCDGAKIQYIGWVKSSKSYEYFAASDLVVFPGRHSVFWEQVAAQGVPMVCRKWEGTQHVNVGGNTVFCEKDTVEEWMNIITLIVKDKNKYEHMRRNAIESGKDIFSYKRIAQKSISV